MEAVKSRKPKITSNGYRTGALWNVCHFLTRWIERDKLLGPIWTPETAADILWMMILNAEESLRIERGWSKEDYVKRLQYAVRRALTTMELNI